MSGDTATTAPVGRRRSEAFFRITSLVALPIVAVGGWCIHVYVLPLPIQSGWAAAFRFAYFLLWLGTLLHLLGTTLFGSRRRGWHAPVYILLGLPLGAIGGLFFAGRLGFLIGALSGLMLGPIVFLLREPRVASPSERR